MLLFVCSVLMKSLIPIIDNKGHMSVLQNKTLKVQSHGIVRLQNRTICEKSCGCKTSLQLYLRFVGVVCVVTCIRDRSETGCN